MIHLTGLLFRQIDSVVWQFSSSVLLLWNVEVRLIMTCRFREVIYTTTVRTASQCYLSHKVQSASQCHYSHKVHHMHAILTYKLRSNNKSNFLRFVTYGFLTPRVFCPGAWHLREIRSCGKVLCYGRCKLLMKSFAKRTFDADAMRSWSDQLDDDDDDAEPRRRASGCL